VPPDITRPTPTPFIPYRLPALNRSNEFSVEDDPDGTFQGLYDLLNVPALEIRDPAYRSRVLPPFFRSHLPTSLKSRLQSSLTSIVPLTLPPTRTSHLILRAWTTTVTMPFSTTSSNRSVLSLPPVACADGSTGQTSGDAWFKPTEENIHSGVCLRVDQGRFRVFPYENPYLQPFERAIRMLNPVAAVKVRSAAIHAALAHAYVRIEYFPLNLADIPLNPAQKMLNRYLSLRTPRFRLLIR